MYKINSINIIFCKGEITNGGLVLSNLWWYYSLFKCLFGQITHHIYIDCMLVGGGLGLAPCLVGLSSSSPKVVGLWFILLSVLSHVCPWKWIELDFFFHNWVKSQLKKPKGAKVKVFFQGLHVTHVIFVLDYDLK
jgi:hypothetical protein